MKTLQLSAGLLGLALSGVLCCAPDARADAVANQLTEVTFDQPVEIPGRVLLPGTYEFRLVNILTDQDFVEILNADGTHLIAILDTLPVSRSASTDGNAELVLERLNPKAPVTLKEWFYANETTGHEFVYPHHKQLPH